MSCQPFYWCHIGNVLVLYERIVRVLGMYYLIRAYVTFLRWGLYISFILS